MIIKIDDMDQSVYDTTMNTPEVKDCPFLAIPNDMKPIIALINRAAHDCTELFNQRLEGVGLSSKSFLILGAAFKNTSFSQQDTANGLFIDRTTMVSLVDELESRGLVERVRHVDDRRQYRIVLTPQGEALFKEAREIAYLTEDEYLSVLSDEQRQDLRGSLLLVLNARNEKKKANIIEVEAKCCWGELKEKVKKTSRILKTKSS